MCYYGGFSPFAAGPWAQGMLVHTTRCCSRMRAPTRRAGACLPCAHRTHAAFPRLNHAGAAAKAAKAAKVANANAAKAARAPAPRGARAPAAARLPAARAARAAPAASPLQLAEAASAADSPAYKGCRGDLLSSGFFDKRLLNSTQNAFIMALLARCAPKRRARGARREGQAPAAWHHAARRGC